VIALENPEERMKQLEAYLNKPRLRLSERERKRLLVAIKILVKNLPSSPNDPNWRVGRNIAQTRFGEFIQFRRDLMRIRKALGFS